MARPISIESYEADIAEGKRDLAKLAEAIRAKELTVKVERERLATNRALDIGRLAMACGLADVENGTLEKYFRAIPQTTTREEMQ